MHDAQVAIIGAGPAGLYAAYRLKNVGINVKVFEARSRVGGRLFSDNERMIEFGAWSLGDGGNIDFIKVLTQELGLEVYEAKMPFPGYSLKEDHFKSMHERFKQFIGDDIQVSKQKLSDLIDSCRTVQQVLDIFFEGAPDLKKYCETMAWVYNGSPASEISAHIYKDATIELCLGGVSEIYKHEVTFFPLYRIKGGNDLIAKKLASHLCENIELNKALQTVSKTNVGKLALSFADGTIKEFEQVILALPVFAYHSVQFKDDVISAAQLAGIKATCPGTVAKVLIPAKGSYPSGFFLGDRYSAGITKDERYLTMHWARPVDMTVIKEKVKSLCELLEWRQPKEFIMVNDAYCESYPDDAVLIIDWPHQPFTQGSYCVYSPAQDGFVGHEIVDGMSVNRLFKPHANLYFAGEAASVIAGIGSVGAALESADIVAQLIIERLEQKPKMQESSDA